MGDSRKTKAQLISELEELRRQLAKPAEADGAGGGTRPEQGESEDRFRRLIDSSLLGIYIHIDYCLAYANPALSDLLGYDNPQEVLDLVDVGKLRTPSERKRLREYFEARRAGNPAPMRYEYKALCKDGSEIWLENFVWMVEWRGSRAVMATVIDITDRKQAEEGLSRFKTTLDMTADCVFMFDPETLRFFYVNQGAVKQVEYSEREMLNMTPIDIKPEFDEASFRKMLAPMLAGEISSHRFETVHRSRSGVHIPVEVFLQYIAPQSEEPRFVAIVRDISARQKAVEELQASRQLLKTVFDTVPQYVSMEDAQGRFQIVNQAFAQTYGYEPDDLVGKTLADIAGFDKATLEISNAADRRIFETGRPAPPRRERLILPDGSERIGYVHKLPISDDAGNITGIVTINLDISELEAAQQASRESQERFSAIAHATPYPIAVTGLESGKIFYMNEPYKELFEVTEETVANFRVQDFYADADGRKELVDAINREGKIQYFEREMKKSSGERFWAVMSSVEMQYEGERCVITGLVDITDRKRAEEELSRSEERFRAIAHACPYPITVVEFDSGKFLYANHSCQQMFAVEGVDPADYRAHDFYVNASDRETVVETVKREGKIEFFEREMQNLNGERFWAVSSSVEMQYEGERCVITGLVDITDRKHAVEELRASQRLLQTIFDTVPNWLYTKDAQGRYQTVNRSMAEFFNRHPSDFVGKRIDEIITKEDGALTAVQSDRDVVLLNKMVNLPEAPVAAPDGTTRIRHIVKLPLRDEDGNVIGIVGASEDITERKATEQALRESEARLSDAVDSIPDGFALYDAEDRLVLHNRNYEKAYPGRADYFVPGTKFEDVLREGVRRGEFAEAIGREEEWIAERMHAHKNPRGPFEQRLSDGRWLRIEERRTSQGGIVGLRTDITELKRVEEALRLSEENFRTTLDHSPSAITLKGLDGRFQLSNRRFNTLFELTGKEVVGKTSYDIFPREEADLTVAQDREVVEFGKVIESEQKFTLPDGSVYTCLLAKFPVIGADGKLHGIGTISTDVSAQRKIEQQLRESQKMEAVGQLAGGIAHDFNNMLQVIINRALFARESQQVDDGMNEHLDAIVEAGEHAADLTRQLLAFSRKSVIQTVALNLNDLTVNLMRMVGRVLGEQINLEFRPGQGLHYVQADPGMLEQVILNLCVNARDALPDGGRIHIETANFHAGADYCAQRGWDNPGDFVLLSVQDDGIGMTPEIKERVFEPFFTSKEVGKGTGLGLAMVYGIIRQHGGRLEVESAPGEGSTFTLLLPAMEHHEDIKEQPPAAEPPRGSETILVVEDQPSVKEIISRMLTSRGYKVLTASDGEEAVDVFNKHADEISLVLLDMVLPKMSGRETMTQIRMIRPDAAVLFSTGYSADSVDKEFLGGNALRLIQKPYASQELLETVREVIDQR